MHWPRPLFCGYEFHAVDAQHRERTSDFAAFAGVPPGQRQAAGFLEAQVAGGQPVSVGATAPDNVVQTTVRSRSCITVLRRSSYGAMCLRQRLIAAVAPLAARGRSCDAIYPAPVP